VFFTTEIYSPEIRPAKTVVDLNGGAPERGDVLEYTVRLTNAGQDAATGLSFFDPIPARSTYVTGSLGITPVAPGATCPAFPPGPGPTDATDSDQAEFDSAANRVVYRLGTGATGDASGRLDPGQTVCVRLRVTIDPDAPLGTQVVNQGSANFFGETLGTPFPDVLSNEAAVTVSGADLVPTKTHAGGAFVAGQSYDFTIGVPNAGDIATDGTTVTVTDPFPAAAFSSVNTAVGSGWTCLPVGLAVTCTRSDALAAGQAWPPITVNATVANPAPATVVNTAEVAGGGDVDASNDSATDAGGAVAQADLALTKVSDVTTTPARRDVTFTLEVTNRGPSTASAVQVTDALAPNFQANEVTTTRGTCTTTVVCQLGSLAPGDVATVTIAALVLDGAEASTATNTATVQDTGASSDPVPDNDTAQVDIAVPPSSDLQVVKSVSPPEPQAGGPVTFTIPVTNTGPSVANNVTVSDAIPPEIVFASVTGTFDGGTCVANTVSRLIRCERGALAPGDTATIVIQATLAPDSRGKTILNSVQAISDSVDPQPELAKDTVAFVPIPAVDLELTKVALDVPARPGGIARFGVQVANHGPSDAPDVVVRDALPPGLTFVSDTRGACSAAGAAVTCLLGELASGAAIDDWEIDVRVDPSLAGRTIRNAASIDSEPSDPALQPTERIPSSNADAADLEVAQTADLRITKTVTPATVTAGGEVTYAIRVTNDGPGEATAIRVGDVIPDALAVRSVTATQGSCDTGAAIVCDLGTLSPGATAEVLVTAAVGADRAGSTIVNAAGVAAAEVDLDQSDNLASASLSVVAPPAGALSLSPPECLAGTLRLVDVAAGATRVHLAGETAKADAGRTVTLLFRGRRVGTATVAATGTFAATVPLPARAVRDTNQARYQAVLGPLRSLNLKLARRMRATELSTRPGTVTIAGRVTSPLARPVRTVTLRRYKDCTGTSFTVVKRDIEVSGDGRFRATVAAPEDVDVAYYRALTRVRKTTRNPKTYETFTLIRGVTLTP
jgi:large repetitive protein